MGYTKEQRKQADELFKQGLKRCYACGVIKKLGCFTKDSHNKYGVYYNCKKCKNKIVRENSVKSFIHRKKKKLQVDLYKKELKKCTKCLEIKKIEKFSKRSQKIGDLQPVCKECTKKYKKAYREKNRDFLAKKDKERYENKKEEQAERYKKYYKKNKRDIIERVLKYKLSMCSSESYVDKINNKDPSYEVKFDGTSVWVKCYHCKKWYVPINREVDGFLQTTDGLGNIYCSDKCKQDCFTFQQISWPKNHKPDISREVQPQLREMRLEIDNHECQVCFSKERLECHHYDGVELNPVESADLDRCITICHACHKNLHKIHGYTYRDFMRKPCKV